MDSREPVMFGPGVEVIDSPEAALFVLSHTCEKIFDPLDALQDMPQVVPEEPTYIALCEPGVPDVGR